MSERHFLCGEEEEEDEEQRRRRRERRERKRRRERRRRRRRRRSRRGRRRPFLEELKCSASLCPCALLSLIQESLPGSGR